MISSRQKQLGDHRMSGFLNARILAAMIASLSTVTLCLPSAGYAQTAATGSLHGRVLNAANGMYLGNARVTVDGTNIETFTNQFGEYTLNNLPAGNITIRITYTGQAPRTASVAVISGKDVVQDVTFNADQSTSTDDGTLVLSEFTVAASRFRSAQELATNEERYSPTIKNVVSTDSFGDIPSGNIGEMVKFIPGVQIDYGNVGGAQFGNAQRDASRVSVRGFDEQDTAILIDGLPIASASPGSLSRTINLDMLSVNNASRVEVIKVATPDMPANSIGGQINLITKSAFEFKEMTTILRLFTQMSPEDTITLRRTPAADGGSSYKIQPSFEGTVILPLTSTFGVSVTGSRLYEYGNQVRAQSVWFHGGRSQQAPATAYVPNLITNSAGVGLSYSNPYFSRLQLTETPQETERYSGNIKFDWKPNKYNKVALNLQYSQFTGYESGRRLSVGVGGSNNGGLVSSNINNTGTAGGGVINSAGVLSLNATPLDWGSNFTISRATSTPWTTGNSAGLEVFNNFDKDGDTKTGSLIYEFKNAGWTVDLKASRSVATVNFETTKNGHLSGAEASMSNLGTIKLLNIDEGVPREIQIFRNDGTQIDFQNLASWNPNNFNGRFGDAHSKNTVSVYTLDMKRTLEFIPVDLLRTTSIKMGVRRDEIKVEKWGSGTNLTEDFNAANTGGLTIPQLFSMIRDDRLAQSPGFGLPSQQWMDSYKLYELDQKYEIFKATIPNQKSAYDAFVGQQKDFVERRDGWYAMFDSSFLSNRLFLTGGVRQEKTTRKGKSEKRFNSSQFVTYADGRRYTDTYSPSGYSITTAYSASNPRTAVFGPSNDANAVAARARMDALGLWYPTTPLSTSTTHTDALILAARARKALQPIDGEVKGDLAPMLAANYELTENLGVKLSWSRSFKLPKIEDATNGLLSGGGSYVINDYDASTTDAQLDDAGEGYQIGGYYGFIQLANPNLQPAISDNWDVQLNYYTKSGGKLSATYFYKTVTNETATITFGTETDVYQQIAQELDLGGKSYYLNTAINLPGKLHTHGYEFEARQNLEPLGLWGWGKAVTVFGSWTINSFEDPKSLPPITVRNASGQLITTTPKTSLVTAKKAGHSGSFGIFFEKSRFSATVKGVYRGENETNSPVIHTYTGNVGRTFEPEELRVDVSLNYRLTKIFSIYGAARDLTYHRKNVETRDDMGLTPSYSHLTDQRVYGAVVTAGVRAEF